MFCLGLDVLTVVSVSKSTQNFVMAHDLSVAVLKYKKTFSKKANSQSQKNHTASFTDLDLR
jgi:hypothetical protein